MTPASLVSNRAPWQAGCDDAVCSVCTTQVFCGDSVLWHCPAHGLPVGWALSHPPLESLAALDAARAACQQGPGAPSVPVAQDDDNSSDERLMADFDTMQGPDAGSVRPRATTLTVGATKLTTKKKKRENAKKRGSVFGKECAPVVRWTRTGALSDPPGISMHLCRQVFYRLS